MVYRPPRMQMPILTGLPSPSVVALAPHSGCCSPLSNWRTGNTHNGTRLGLRTAGLLHDPRARGALPQRPNSPGLYTTVHSAPAPEKRNQAHSWKGWDDWTGLDLAPAPLEKPHSHPRDLDPAPAVTVVEIKRPAHPRGRRNDDRDRRGRSPGRCPAPPGSGCATAWRGITVIRQAAVVAVVKGRGRAQCRDDKWRPWSVVGAFYFIA